MKNCSSIINEKRACFEVVSSIGDWGVLDSNRVSLGRYKSCNEFMASLNFMTWLEGQHFGGMALSKRIALFKMVFLLS